MSMGIYYEAKRSIPISEKETAQIEKITDKYLREYTRKDQYEGPGTFSLEDGGDADCSDVKRIYRGMLRIPTEFMEDEADGAEAMEEFLAYWLKWLTDVTRELSEAEWEASLEEVPLIWEDKTGWRVMSDQEYEQMGLV